MKKSFLLALVALFFFQKLTAQSCLPDGIVFNTQAAIDAFPTNFPGCKFILGNLEILGSSDIANLNGLASLTHVGGKMDIKYNANLTNLSGLNNLTTVDGNVLFYGNKFTTFNSLNNLTTVGGSFEIQSSSIVNLNGLQNLVSVGQDLFIWINGSMTTISGLNKLTSVGNAMRISQNSNLVNLTGLNALKWIGGGLQMQFNPLTNFTGMASLKSVGGVFELYNNDKNKIFAQLDSVGRLDLRTQARDMSAFPNLSYSGSGLDIQYSPKLKNLKGMAKLTTLAGLKLMHNVALNSLVGLENIDTMCCTTISENDSLTSLRGLDNVQFFTGEMRLENNPNLSECAIDLICRNLLFTNQLYIWNNAPGCYSLSDLPENCAYPVQAKVLFDKNSNCLPDSLDTPAVGVQVRLSDAVQLSLRETEFDGIAPMSTRTSYFFTLDLPHFPNKNWAVCQDSILVDPGSLTDTVRQTMLLKPLVQCPELTVRLGLPSVFQDCSKTSAITVAATNSGTVAAISAKAAVVIPAGLQLVGAVPPVSMQVADTLFFDLGNIEPFATATVHLTVKTVCSGLQTGQSLCVEAFGRMTNSCPLVPPNFSEIHISSECLGNATVRFTLKNIGNQPTQGAHEYIISKNKLRQPAVSFSLAPQEILVVNIPANGATFRMEATKLDDGTLTARSHESCGGFTPGYVTGIWQDEGAVGRDFGCRQFGAAPATIAKSAIPAGVGNENFITPNRPIEYTIDFQNIGLDSAHRAVVRDQLSPYLDVSDFRPVAASSAFTWEIRGGHLLEIIFEDAKIPSGGRGFFTFSIAQKAGIPNPAELQNMATVSFDYAVPAATNTLKQIITELPAVGYGCLPQGISFANQAEVNNFPIEFEGCWTLLGDVQISGGSISSLVPLQQLHEIKGHFWNNDLVLNNFAGLDSLRSIGKDFNVYGCQLKSMVGLEKLERTGEMYVWNNPKLKDMTGLGSLKSISGALSVRNNILMKNFVGMQKLAAVGNLAEILENPALTGLTGLEGLTSVKGGVKIYANGQLANLNGLENLTKAGAINLDYNLKLTDVSALANLDSLGGLAITYHPLLVNLNGLGKFDTLAGNLKINNNPILADLSGLAHCNAITGNATIKDSPGLASLAGFDNLKTVGGEFSLMNLPLVGSLSPLSNLKKVGSLLIEECHGLTNLTGLENLTDTVGSLLLRNDSGLTDLSALSNLTVISENLAVAGLNALPNLNGLGNLQSVGGYCQFVLPLLQNLDGLGPIEHIGGDLTFSQCNSLNSLSELKNLKTIGGGFGLSLNQQLPHLGGLNNLKSIGGTMNFDANEALTNLDSLENLETIGGNLQLTGNIALSDCSIFAVCGHLLFGPNAAYISSNAPGCNDSAEVVMNCQILPVVATVLIDKNADCLPDAADLPIRDIQIRLDGAVLLATRPTDSTGIAPFKYLRDGTFLLDLPEFPTKNWDVCLEPVAVSTVGAADTVRAAIVLSPIYQCPDLLVEMSLPSQFRGCFVQSDVQILTQNIGTVTAEMARLAVVMPPIFDILNVVPPISAQSGDTLFFDLGDLEVFEKAIIKLTVKTRCDVFVFGQTACWESFATLKNGCPSNLPPMSEIKLSAKCLGDSMVRFTLENIGDASTASLHEYRIFRNAEMSDPTIFSLAAHEKSDVDIFAQGHTYRMEATKFNDGTRTATAIEGCNGLSHGQITAFWLEKGPDNYDFDCREIIGSFDPNQKTAVPIGAGFDHAIEANQPFFYTINFQNTGTDTAFRVALHDVLSANFDAATFRPLSASHPFSWEINGTDTLDVLFLPILLPDSNVNEPASHGFFSFEINQKSDLPDGTVFENMAEIVFDFNPPILTNLVRHVIGSLPIFVETTEVSGQEKIWKIEGNPTRDAAIFRAVQFVAGEKRFELFDAAGRFVRKTEFSGQTFEFRRDELSSGFYFFKINDESGNVFSGKIVVVD
jgi:uncharacterized repeat protein (TIGR01451 family)